MSEENKKQDENDELIKKIVAPHTKKSRDVKYSDIDRVIQDSKILSKMCLTPVGLFKGGFALHHSQIDDVDPLNFFVTDENHIIINPRIINHVNYEVDSLEGCLSFSSLPEKVVKRWRKIEVEYQYIIIDPDNKEKLTLSDIKQETLKGKIAFIFQHECDHSKGKFIY